MAIGIIGAGRAGSALALAAAAAGHRIAGVADRDEERAAFLASRLRAPVLPPALLAEAAGIVFLCVPDTAIASAAGELSRVTAGIGHRVYMHLSGAHSSSLLEPLKGRGALGSLHPMLSLADPEEGARRLRTCYYAFEGDPEAERAARSFVESLGGRFMMLRARDKVRYHAAAVFLSNYLVALIDISLGLYASFGLTEDEAMKAAWPLLEATLANVRRLGTAAALTGPISRGDALTVREHLQDLEKMNTPAADVYRSLGRATLYLARNSGRLDPGQEAALLDILGGGEVYD